MATIAIDATYTVDPEPSGVAVYSRRLIESLQALDPPHRFIIGYRLSRWRERRRFLHAANGRRAQWSRQIYQEPVTFWLPRQAELFHSLAQRPAPFHFRREVVTVFDLFPITGANYSAPGFRRKFSELLREAVRRAARIVALSRSTAIQLAEVCGARQEQICVIPAGVDVPERLMEQRERVAERERLVGRGCEMVLAVGAIQNRKNTLNAVRALATLPANYRLVLAGGDGYGSEAVHEFIRREQLEQRVVRMGYVAAERLPALYQAASVFLFPSLEEGFGFPVLEAMAFGTPVVTSHRSSLPEVAADAALYVNPQDVAGIAGAVRRAAEDAALRAGLIAQGRKRAGEFTWRRTAEQTLAVYEELLAT